MIGRALKTILKILVGGALLIAVIGTWLEKEKSGGNQPESVSERSELLSELPESVSELPETKENLKLSIRRDMAPLLTEDQITEAVRIFKKACQPLGNKYWGDVEKYASGVGRRG